MTAAFASHSFRAAQPAHWGLESSHAAAPPRSVASTTRAARLSSVERGLIAQDAQGMWTPLLETRAATGAHVARRKYSVWCVCVCGVACVACGEFTSPGGR